MTDRHPRYRHGEAYHRTREYRIWVSMRARCADRFSYVGRRGLGVCGRWNSYENFLADMGRTPSAQHTLDRRDNDKGYSPDNCRWATHREQQNNRRNCRYYTFNEETRTLVEWARHLNMGFGTLWNRLRYYNWDVARALTQPVEVHMRKTSL